eukprot:31023-Pelagococcus_subviridis.AAC.1
MKRAVPREHVPEVHLETRSRRVHGLRFDAVIRLDSVFHDRDAGRRARGSRRLRRVRLVHHARIEPQPAASL